MIDPNILLKSQTPTELAQGAANVAQTNQQTQNLANVGQLQQGELAQQPGQLALQAKQLAASDQENQQRQIQLDNQNFTNQALTQNVKTNPATGQSYIDHAGVYQNLVAAGHGTAALNYMQASTAVQKGYTDLQEAQQKLANAHQEHAGAFASAILNVPLDKDGGYTARASAYALARPMAIQAQDLNENQLPPMYTPALDGALGQIRDQAITPAQQVTEANRKAEVAIASRRADTQDQRLSTYQQAVDQRGDTQGAAQAETARHNLVMESQGQQRVDNSAAGGGLTANAQGVQARFVQKEIDANRKLLDGLHQQRTAIGGALAVQNGEQYVDPKTGKIAPDSMNDEIRSTLQGQYRNATNAGQRIMTRYGGAASGNQIQPNEFGGQPAQPAAPQTPQRPLAPQAPRSAGSKGAVPLSKVQQYAQQKNITLPQAQQEFQNFGYSVSPQ